MRGEAGRWGHRHRHRGSLVVVATGSPGAQDQAGDQTARQHWLRTTATSTRHAWLGLRGLGLTQRESRNTQLAQCGITRHDHERRRVTHVPLRAPVCPADAARARQQAERDGRDRNSCVRPGERAFCPLRRTRARGTSQKHPPARHADNAIGRRATATEHGQLRAMTRDAMGTDSPQWPGTRRSHGRGALARRRRPRLPVLAR